ncbi:MAG: hypothetical protein EA397_12480 [Deltaproteobacteria bacterium]|nr:MAG: hypothetical protein EA397_12480 [Deltaproteobacteria bacterium]
MVAILGVIAMVLGASAPCTSCIGPISMFVLSVITIVMARSALADEPLGEDLAYANVGLWTSVAGIIIGLIYIVFFILYIAVVIGFVVMTS